jgi:hypothetical protein
MWVCVMYKALVLACLDHSPTPADIPLHGIGHEILKNTDVLKLICV